MGSALHVALPGGLKPGDSINVWLKYTTSATATALQWLGKEFVSQWLSGMGFLNVAKDKRKEKNFHSCSASASLHTLGLWLRCKV